MKNSVLAAAGALLLASPALAASINNGPDGGSILAFGFEDSQTYGIVFTAPVTGTLHSFTLYLNGGVGGDLRGGIGVWNGPATYAEGFGVSSVPYLSGLVDSGTGGAFTFAPNLAVTAGTLYVAFLTVNGTNATLATSMPTGVGAPGVNYFVWANASSGALYDSESWSYSFDLGPGAVQFDADFTMIPEPATWAMLIAGFGLVGSALRRRRGAVAA